MSLGCISPTAIVFAGFLRCNEFRFHCSDGLGVGKTFHKFMHTCYVYYIYIYIYMFSTRLNSRLDNFAFHLTTLSSRLGNFAFHLTTLSANYSSRGNVGNLVVIVSVSSNRRTLHIANDNHKPIRLAEGGSSCGWIVYLISKVGESLDGRVFGRK